MPWRRYLLVVAHVVLDSRAHALALHALDVTDCRPGGEKRILTEVFEVAAALRSTINVDAWAEHEMNSTGTSVLADDLAHPACEVRVPGSGQAEAPERRRRAIVANAERSVGHL